AVGGFALAAVTVERSTKSQYPTAPPAARTATRIRLASTTSHRQPLAAGHNDKRKGAAATRWGI
ncbi:hypothetical protein, partial [Lacticaseibacillus pantheris]